MTQPDLQPVDLQPIDPARFRAAMGLFTTGVVVITTTSGTEYHGMTANSLTSVSLDPCLLLVCLRRGSPTGLAIRERGAFAINLLSNDQVELSRRFVGKLDERFRGLDIQLDDAGLPLLPDSLAHFSCRVHDIHAAGDHDIVVGEVVSSLARDGEPLVFFRGGVGRHRLHTPDLV